MDYIKNNKGFTLIELMATLAILALIVLIAVPAVGSIINNADESAEANSIKMIEKAGSLADVGGLAHDRPGVYDVTTLIDAGYLDLDDTDPLAAATAYVAREGNGNAYVYYGMTDFLPPEEEEEAPVMRDHDKPDRPEDVVRGSGEYTYRLMEGSDTEVEITGYSDYDALPDHLDIPAVIDGYDVVRIGDGAFASASSRPIHYSSVTIPEGVRSVGIHSFGNWHEWPQQLTSVSLPSTLERIEQQAFIHNGLTSVDIPESVSYIEGYAFYRWPASDVRDIGTSMPVMVYASEDSYAADFAENIGKSVEYMGVR